MMNQVWNSIWSDRTVEQEIKMGDFYSGRQFILKYLPRWGVSIEAGCGLGRYVFYLSDLDLNIIGTEISEIALNKCRDWAAKNGYSGKNFRYGDVRNLPFPDNYFSGYISLGVIEHFKEGPQKALKEAYRVLRPGGMAIISTPNKYSLEFLFYELKKSMKSPVKYMLSLLKLYQFKNLKEEFFQYEFSVNELAQYIKHSGFRIIEKATIDMKYPIYELFKLHSKLVFFRKIKSFIFLFSDLLERTALKFLGGLSIVVACKATPKTVCFFCGAGCEGHGAYQIPICKKCATTIPDEILSYYSLSKKTVFKKTFLNKLNRPGRNYQECYFCGGDYQKDDSFDDYGFSVNVCPNCLKDPIINLKLSNLYIKENWQAWE